MIDKIISTAVKFYLRSQVERLEDLQLKITGSNGQILKGNIPQVFLSCSKGVYQGLHLSQVELTGTKIAFNVVEVVKQRQPLKLLEPIDVDITVLLTAADFQASLASPLLLDGLTHFLSSLLANNHHRQITFNQIVWSDIAIAEPQLSLRGTLINLSGKTIELNLVAGLALADTRTLLLSPLQITTTPELTIEHEDCFKIDLGTEVAITEFAVQADKIWCSGKITILP